MAAPPVARMFSGEIMLLQTAHLITGAGGPGRPRYAWRYLHFIGREELGVHVPEASGDADDGHARVRRRDQDARRRGEREGVRPVPARPLGLRRQREGAVHPRLRPCPVPGQPLASRGGVCSGFLCRGGSGRAA